MCHTVNWLVCYSVYYDLVIIIYREYLISSLPGKTSRMLVELRGLPSDSTCVLEALPGNLDIKSNEPGILSVYPLFHSSN